VDAAPQPAITGRTPSAGTPTPPDRTLRRRRGVPPQPPVDRPDEAVWKSGEGADAVVDTPAVPGGEQTATPALGRQPVRAG
jgi:hypothetical protein